MKKSFISQLISLNKRALTLTLCLSMLLCSFGTELYAVDSTAEPDVEYVQEEENPIEEDEEIIDENIPVTVPSVDSTLPVYADTQAANPDIYDSGIYFDESMLQNSTEAVKQELVGINILHGFPTDIIEVERGNNVLLNASSDSAVDGFVWQISINGKWYNICDDGFGQLNVTYAMIANALVDDMAYIRAVSYCEGYDLVSNPVIIKVVEPMVAEVEPTTNIPEVTPTDTVEVTYELTDADGNLLSSSSEDNSYLNQDSNENLNESYGIATASEIPNDAVTHEESTLPEMQIYNVAVQYVYGYDGNNPNIQNVPVAEFWIATIAKDSTLNTVLTVPTIVGYYPVLKNTTFPQAEISLSNYSLAINYNSAQQDIEITVEYLPAKNNKFEIYHYLQNVEDDEYGAPIIEVREGATTNAPVKNYEKNVMGYQTLAQYHAGFYPLAYDGNVRVAADGSTVVEIYYDRYFYLMDFDIGLNAYGVEPQYAKFEAPIMVDTPYRPGYTFNKWVLHDPSYESNPELFEAKGDGNDSTELLDISWTEGPPATMPKFNLTYEADWTPNPRSSVYIVVWGWNPNVNNGAGRYAYLGSTNIAADTGSSYTYTVNHVHDSNCEQCPLDEHTHTPSCRARVGDKFQTVEDTSGPLGWLFPTQYTEDDIEYNGELIDGRIGVLKTGSGSTLYYVYHADTKAWYTYNADKIDLDVLVPVSSLPLDCGIPEHTHKQGECGCERLEMDSNLWVVNNEMSTDLTVTVLPNGESQIHVFYDRTEFTVGFRKQYSNINDYGEITAAWGTNIGDRWTEICTTANCTNWSEKSDGGGPWTGYLDTMPAKNITFYVGGDGSNVATYYIQNPDGSFVEKFHINGKGAAITKEDFFEIDGFTYSYGVDGRGDNLPSLEKVNNSDEDETHGNFSGAKFYYTRNNYNLEFYSYNELVKTEPTQYEASLAEFAEYIPPDSANHESGSHEFGGWFLSPDCTGEPFDLNTKKMPSNNLVLYAKWTAKKYRVEIYRSYADMENAANAMTQEAADSYIMRDNNGNMLANLAEYHSYVNWLPTEDDVRGTDPIYQQLSFRGWFYHNTEHHDEHYFNSSIPIILGMSAHAPNDNTELVYWTDTEGQYGEVGKEYEVIRFYGRWTSDVLREYEIQYVLAKVERDADGNPIMDGNGNSKPILDVNGNYTPDTDAQGNIIYVAPTETGSALGGTSKTFEAKVDTEILLNYREGHYPHVPSHTLVLDAWSENKNTFTFYYIPKTPPIEYRVEYRDSVTRELIDVDTDGASDGIKYGSTNKAIITEQFIPIVGYIPDAFQKRLVISANEDSNVLVFYYTANELSAPIQLTYMVEDLPTYSIVDGQKVEKTPTYSVYTESFFTGNKGLKYDIADYPISIPGFTAMTAVPEGYLVNTGKVDADDNPIMVTPTMSAVLDENGLHLYQFFERNEYPYVFYFMDYTSPDYPLFSPVTGSAHYMETVEMEYPNIPGFAYAGTSAKQSMIIRIEDGDTNNNGVIETAEIQHNERIFYYTPLTVMLDYDIIGPEKCASVSVHVQNVQSFYIKRTEAVTPTLPTFDEAHSDIIPCHLEYDPNKFNFLGWTVKDANGNLITDSEGNVIYLTNENAAQYNASFVTYKDPDTNIEYPNSLMPVRQIYSHDYGDGRGEQEMGYYFPGNLIFYAVFEAKETVMTITRTDVDVIDVDQSFVYRLVGTDENTKDIALTVTVHVPANNTSGSVTINEVPIGKYTITEVTDWSWRYTPNSNTIDVTTEPGKKANVTVGNSSRNPYWLNGTAYACNKFNEKS